MNLRISFVLAASLLAAACSSRSDQSSDVGTAASTGASAAAAAKAASGPAYARAPGRFGAVPDRGAVVAYPAAAAAARRDGAYTYHRVDLSEQHALGAIGGVLTLPLPSGEQLRYRYDRHVVHPDGNWTWVGTSLADASREALITFGEKAAFGSLGQPGKEPLRLTMERGTSWLVETDPRLIAGIINSATRPRGQDFFIAPEIAGAAADGSPVAGSSDASVASATTASGTTIDVLVGYTTGFAAALGGESQALTRINFLVDVTNEAYANSQIAANVRLVRAMSVNYPDNTANGTALEELTGFKAPSTKTTPSAAFSALRAARDQYGADMVSLLRKFNDPENDGCGIAWLIGGGRSGVDQSDEYFAYSVSSDGKDEGTDGKTYFCRDETFAHELGHNMGSAHDRDQADGDDNVLQSKEYGVFDYSFGYKTDAANGNFYTVMAYGDKGQTRYRVFSNPRVTLCGGLVCGTAEADNARSLNNTVATAASWRATVVGTPPPAPPAPPPALPPTTSRRAPYDVSGDGRSDVLLSGGTALAFWAMNGTTRTFDSYLGTGGTGWRVVAFGDFDGAAGADVLWANGSQMKIWFNMGGGNYVVYLMGTYGNGFEPIAAADVNGDGKSDILLRNGTAIAYWLLDGATVLGNAYAGDGGAGFRVVTTGDFNGDGADEIVWANGSQIKMWVNGRAAGFSAAIVGTYGNGYAPFAAGYVDGDAGRDLIFRAGTSIAYWKLSGATKVSDAYLGDIGSGYAPFAVGDYNGDGASDIGLQNGSTIKFWMNNGFGGYTPGVVGNYVCCYMPIGNP